MRWRSGTLDDLYFEWLYEQIADVGEIDPRKTHWELTKRLYCTEFLFFVPNDDNRAQDGLELRELFLEMEEIDPDPYWDTLPCSVLEMLVSLARRMEFEGGRSIEHWFWMFIDNMDLKLYTDAYYDLSPGNRSVMEERIVSSTDRLIYRLYSWNGQGGGLFHVNYPLSNMPETELWYQMAAYLREEV